MQAVVPFTPTAQNVLPFATTDFQEPEVIVWGDQDIPSVEEQEEVPDVSLTATKTVPFHATDDQLPFVIVLSVHAIPSVEVMHFVPLFPTAT